MMTAVRIIWIILMIAVMHEHTYLWGAQGQKMDSSTLQEDSEKSSERDTDAQETAQEYEDDEEDSNEQESLKNNQNNTQPKKYTVVTNQRIRNIAVEGNIHVPLEPILNAIPFHAGELFVLERTNKLIQNIYALGYFRQVSVYVEDVNDEQIDLIVVVEEKPLLDGVKFCGNKHLSEKEIEKKVDFSKIPAIDQDDLPKYIAILKRLYRDKDYHDVKISARLEGDAQHVTAIFDINEGRQTLIKRVCFVGNNYFRSKQLRSLLFTREDWILGFLDRAGSYQPEAIEADKFVIENYYQSNGFYNARITKTTVDIDPVTKGATVTFYVHEGDQYTISQVHAPGNEVLPEETLCALIPIRPGQLYSKERIRETLELLRKLWGNYGYIHADVEPAIQPDDATKTVAVSFYSELGQKVYVNRINIIGHCKTIDKVIRRQLLVEEGCLLTIQALDDSKARVEALGYFETHDGVNWRINRIAPDKVDLDLVVRETKTGRFEAQMGFGGNVQDVSSPADSFTVGINLSETNFLGRGILVNANASYAKEERSLVFSISDPWLFDRPIHGTADVYVKRSLYDEFKFIEQPNINENITGGGFGLGALSAKLGDATVSGRIGIDGITYQQTPRVKRDVLPPDQADELQAIFDRRFTSGAFIWFGLSAFKDIRNHPMHPSRGYQWAATAKFVAHSHLKDNPKDNPARQEILDKERVRFGYSKFDFDASWYTPLIGERDLVLCLHGHLGLVAPFKKRSVPFRELFNVGGPASVRGFLFGEIGPMYFSPTLNDRDMLGAKNAFWFNVEMIFPISSDFAIKGAVFYDGGAGWDTPDSFLINPAHLKNNNFAFRHAVGFGVRILRPTPVKIDWGFKLDRKKGESPSEVHFSMYHEF